MEYCQWAHWDSDKSDFDSRLLNCWTRSIEKVADNAWRNAQKSSWNYRKRRVAIHSIRRYTRSQVTSSMLQFVIASFMTWCGVRRYTFLNNDGHRPLGLRLLFATPITDLRLKDNLVNGIFCSELQCRILRHKVVIRCSKFRDLYQWLKALK